MSDRMIPIPFDELMNRVFSEYRKYGTVYGVRAKYVAAPGRKLELFHEKLETPFGPAAGPNSQLAQNIIAAYWAGSRFFELKTVQKLDGEDLPVSKPCILAEDECYNCEWSTELYVPQAFDEYVKAWWACKLIALELGIGSPDGFIFNMSVGYDLEGIKSPKIDKFIEGMKDASNTPIWAECEAWALAHAADSVASSDAVAANGTSFEGFKNIKSTDIAQFSSKVCTSITLSTLHGCPAEDIEKIASYLISEKKLNTFIKCNPTLLGYEYARKTLDSMGYDYIQFGEFHFNDDLQYKDAVPMLKRLKALAGDNCVEFGVKLTNTFPVDVKRKELPSEEMYMSGKSLYPLSLSVASKLAHDFDGKLRISFSGGADAFNITKLYELGIWPITFATTILKPGGYNRISQIASEFESESYGPFEGISANGIDALIEEAKKDIHHIKPIKARPSRKLKKQVPLTDCFVASCEEGCPVHQDITAYMRLAGEGRYLDALKVVALKNPLPNITGTICAHACMSRCTRNFYEEPVHIRDMKLTAARAASVEFEKYLGKLKLDGSIKPVGKKAAIIGAGPAGIAAAYFLARAGFEAVVYEKRLSGGGTVGHVIQDTRIPRAAIAQDLSFAAALGVKFIYGREIKSIDELKSQGFDYVVVAVGAGKPGKLSLEGCETVNAIEFLERCALRKAGNIGKNVAVIGGGNTAMDTARAAKALDGVEKVYLVYRRDRRNMPADEEELELAIKEGVEFKELCAPFEYSNGKLRCKKTVLGDYDASGRQGIVETDEIVEIPADTVIAAVGEKIDTGYYSGLGIDTDEKGQPIVNKANESSVADVYIAGDGLKGPATIIEAVRDAQVAADDIIKKQGIDIYMNPIVSEGYGLVYKAYSSITEAELQMKKGTLNEALKGEPSMSSDGERCLGCNKVCENCVDVCPNRANISIKVPGMPNTQILHIDRMCNECGNCTVFCPYASSPYKDKFTVFESLASFKNSENQGFMLLDDEHKTFRVRLDGQVTDEDVFAEHCSLPKELKELIKAAYTDYRFIF